MIQQDTLAEQQQARKNSTEFGTAHGVTPRLDPPEKVMVDDKAVLEARVQQAHRDAYEFSLKYPQLKLDSESDEGQHNRRIMSQWLKDHAGADGTPRHGTLRNLIAAFHDNISRFMLTPKAIGIDAAPALGSTLARTLTAAQWDALTRAR